MIPDWREDEVRARIALSLLAEPGDEKVGRQVSSDGVVATVQGMLAAKAARIAAPELSQMCARQLEMAAAVQGRPLTPGCVEWPSQLRSLGSAAPYLLWVSGGADLRVGLLRSVSVVGARACTGYGRRLAEDWSAKLAGQGWTVVSGGAFGIDAAAHRGALVVDGQTVLVTAGGVDLPYPRAHRKLYEQAQARGAVVSELPLGTSAVRHRFLVRNRVIACLSRGTVVIEAALRSGARATAGAAHELNRQVMAAPGPVTSDLSSGCHELVREGQAVLVSDWRQVAELLSPLGGDDPVNPGQELLMAALAREGPATAGALGVSVGGDPAEVTQTLAELAAAGRVRLVRGRWELSPQQAAARSVRGTLPVLER